MKAKPYLLTLLTSILAGFSIALGGLSYIVVSSCGPSFKYLGSFTFGIGLLLVCLCSLFLYTGKIGFVINEKPTLSYILKLIIGLIGNFIGAVAFGYFTRLFLMDNIDIINQGISIAEKRMVDLGSGGISFHIPLESSVLCGALVFLAVYFFKKDIPLGVRVFILLFCVFTFVALGFEHCIANMFYISFANMWNLQTVVNVLIVIAGNSIGAILTNLVVLAISKLR